MSSVNKRSTQLSCILKRKLCNSWDNAFRGIPNQWMNRKLYLLFCIETFCVFMHMAMHKFAYGETQAAHQQRLSPISLSC